MSENNHVERIGTDRIDHRYLQLKTSADAQQLLREALRRRMSVLNISMRTLAEFLAVDVAALSNYLAGGVIEIRLALQMLTHLFDHLSAAERHLLVQVSRISDIVVQFSADDVLEEWSGADAESEDWPRCRALLASLQKEQCISLRELSRRSGISAPALSRFIRAETMSLGGLSVLKIYLALRDSGCPAESCRELLRAAGMYATALAMRRQALAEIEAVLRTTAPQPPVIRSFEHFLTDQVLGARDADSATARERYDRALLTFHTDWQQTVTLLEQAADASRTTPKLRALSLMTMIMPLTSMGQYRRAALIAEQIERDMLTVMEDGMQAEFFYHRSFLLMQHPDALVGLEATNRALEYAREGSERDQLIERSAHHFAMLYQRLARQERSPLRRRTLLEQAIEYLNLETSNAMRTGSDLRIGFHLLRKAQVYRALGDERLATRLRRRAHVLFRGSHAEAHVAVEEANLLLRFSRLDYERAEQKFLTAHELWSTIGYRAGLSRTLTGIGLTAQHTDRPHTAAQAQLAALLIHPEGTEARLIMQRLVDVLHLLQGKHNRRWMLDFLRELFEAARAADGLFRGVDWDQRHQVWQQQLLQRVGYPSHGVLSESTDPI